MARLRIYVDTSVIGGCFDVEFVTWSDALMRDFRAKRLVPVLSDVTAVEIAAAPGAVRTLHRDVQQGRQLLWVRAFAAGSRRRSGRPRDCPGAP